MEFARKMDDGTKKKALAVPNVILSYLYLAMFVVGVVYNNEEMCNGEVKLHIFGLYILIAQGV